MMYGVRRTDYRLPAVGRWPFMIADVMMSDLLIYFPPLVMPTKEASRRLTPDLKISDLRIYKVYNV